MLQLLRDWGMGLTQFIYHRKKKNKPNSYILLDLQTEHLVMYILSYLFIITWEHDYDVTLLIPDIRCLNISEGDKVMTNRCSSFHSWWAEWLYSLVGWWLCLVNLSFVGGVFRWKFGFCLHCGMQRSALLVLLRWFMYCQNKDWKQGTAREPYLQCGCNVAEPTCCIVYAQGTDYWCKLNCWLRSNVDMQSWKYCSL